MFCFFEEADNFFHSSLSEVKKTLLGGITGFVQKGSESIRDALLQAAKGRPETPICGSASHSEGDTASTASETGTVADSPMTSSSGIWPSNMFMSQYSMLGTNGLAGLQKVLEVKTVML